MPLTLTYLPPTVEAGLYGAHMVAAMRPRLLNFTAAHALPIYGGPASDMGAFTFAAFQAYVRFIEASGFTYSFTQVGVPWDDTAWLTGTLRGNCMNLALGFNYLLLHLGLPVELLGLQQSLPHDPALGKISQKASARIPPADVRGVSARDAAWEYAAAPYPQARITATNALHIRRGMWFPGRHYEEQDVTKSHRDVFYNHWCSFVRFEGLRFPYFDPLVGARYRNGQNDMFESFGQIGTLPYKAHPDNPVYRSIDNMQTLLYAIPDKFHSVTANPVYTAMRQATGAAASDDPGVRMYWRIDPGLDWFERNTGPVAMPEDARPHPLFVQQLFHICEVGRWSHEVSYRAGRTRLANV